MKRQKTIIRDFFQDYRKAKFESTLFSWMVAALLALSIVFVTQDVDTRGLMASVSNIAQNVSYDADLTLQTTGDMSFHIVVWKTMQKVDKLSFLVITDPEKITSLASNDQAVLVETVGPGLWSVSRIYQAETLYPGDVTLALSVNGSLMTAPVTLSDSYFESAGMRYDLTSKGK